MVIDVLEREEEPPFPHSLPEFQRLFPDEAACADYLARARWSDDFIGSHCAEADEPRYISTRLGVLRCRHCRRDTSLTAGTVMERTHTPFSIWFCAAHLVASQTPGMSAVQFQRQLGLSRYETAFQILHKLRASMVRPDQDRIGGKPEEIVEADETWVGGRTRGKGRYAGCVRLVVVPDRSAKSRVGFIGHAVSPGAAIITDNWSSYPTLGKCGYLHIAVAERGGMQLAKIFLPIIHLVFSNLKTWFRGIHYGVSPQHLQAYLDESTFRFNRRFYPFNAFRSLRGIAGDVTAPTYAQLYAAKSQTTTSSGWVWQPDKQGSNDYG